MELLLSVIGCVSGLLAIGSVAWWASKVNTKVDTLWKLYPEVIDSATRIGVLWRRIMELPIEQGLTKKGSLHLTDKGKSIIPDSLKKKIDSCKGSTDASVVRAVYDDIDMMAKRNGYATEIMFGVISAYLEEKRQ